MKKAVAESKTGWRETGLGSALAAAADMIEDAEADAGSREFATKEIAVVSDFQEGAERDSLNQFAWPEDINVRCVAIAPKDGGNFTLNLVAADAGDDDAAAENESSESDLRRRSRRVRISNGRESESENFSLAWKGSPGTKIETFLPAGASRVMPVPPRPAETADGILEISGDKHEYDNSVYVARAQPRALRILFLGDEVKKTDVGSPLFYLSRAMHKTAVIDPSVVALSFEEFTLNSDELEAADIVVVHGAAPDLAGNDDEHSSRSRRVRR